MLSWQGLLAGVNRDIFEAGMSNAESSAIPGPVRRLLDIARSREEQNLNTYRIYSDITTHGGLRNLLASLATNIRDHLQEIDYLETDLGRADFDPGKVASLSYPDDDVEYAFDATMEYRDFLREIYRREESLTTVYDTLASVCANGDVRFRFERMAEDRRKHMWLAKDRFDLEALR